MLQAVLNAFRLPDLRKKIIFTLMILVIYRFAAHVPIPGVDLDALRLIFEQNQLLGLLNMFSGGAMANFSVMAMGVFPYITAQIVLQLLAPIIPALNQLNKEGEAGREKMNQYTMLLTIPLAALHGFGQTMLLTQAGGGGASVISNFGFRVNPLATVATLLTLTSGTMLAIWLGQLIDEQGIGNGISLIIFSGIISTIPQSLGQMWFINPALILVFGAITAVTVVGIVLVHEGQRRIPVHYAKRVRGNRIYGGQSTHIPLQVNSAGMIPLIFAVSIIMLPGVIASYFVGSNVVFVRNMANVMSRMFDANGVIYWLMYFILVVGFTYFYTDVIFQQQDLPETLRRQGGFVPGIRPGTRTAEYLHSIVRRITLVGALFLGAIAIMPFLVQLVVGRSEMLMTSTGLLIVVGVVLDTMKQLEAQLLMRHYEGFIRRMR